MKNFDEETTAVITVTRIRPDRPEVVTDFDDEAPTLVNAKRSADSIEESVRQFVEKK